MSILKTTVLSQMFIADEMLTTNKVGSIEDSNELIKKSEKLLKFRKLFKLKKSKSEKTFKF